MKISDLQTGQGNVELTATVKELEEIKEFNKYGRILKLRNAVLEDETGFVKLTLWNDDVDKYKVGDKVKITNGYVNEFQNEKQLTAGKFGKLEKVGEGEVEIPSDSSTTAEEPEEAAGLPSSEESEKVTEQEVASEEEVEKAQEEAEEMPEEATI